jgi:hypothetical protein
MLKVSDAGITYTGKFKCLTRELKRLASSFPTTMTVLSFCAVYNRRPEDLGHLRRTR